MYTFHTQFDDQENLVMTQKDFDPCPDFSDEGVMTISELIASMSVGKEVDRFPEGIYEDDQVFDTEFIDVFDHLDKVDELVAQQAASERSSKASPEMKENLAGSAGQAPAQ